MTHKTLTTDLDFKPYLNDEDKEFFHRLGINKIEFLNIWPDDYMIDGIVYAIDDELGYYKHPQCGHNSIFLRSLHIRFMKINKREGNVICDAPWKESI